MRGIPSIGLLENAEWIRKNLSLTWTGEKDEITKTLSLVSPPESAPVPSAKGVAKSLLASKAIGYINEKKAFPDLLCIDFTSIIEAETVSGLLFYEQSDTLGDNMVTYDHVACFTFMKGYELISHAQISKRHYVIKVRNKSAGENQQPVATDINFFLKNASDACRVLLIWVVPEKVLNLTIRNNRSEVTIGVLNPDDLIEEIQEEVIEPEVIAAPATVEPDTVEEPPVVESNEPVDKPIESTAVDIQPSPEAIMPSLLAEWTVDQLKLLREAVTRKITYLEADSVINRVNSTPGKTISMLQHLQTLLELRNLPNPPLKLIDTEVEILQAMLG